MSGVRVSLGAVPGGAGEVEAALRAEGLVPSRWGNGPGFRYGAHDHPYDKVLVCVEGAIVFHVAGGGSDGGGAGGGGGGDVRLEPGDRLELASGTRHAATVGPAGVVCVEAPRPPGADVSPPGAAR